jgi:hypothetical protein
MFKRLKKSAILVILTLVIFTAPGCKNTQVVSEDKFMELLLSNPNKSGFYVEPMGVKNGNAILRLGELSSDKNKYNYTYYVTLEKNLPAKWEEIATQKWHPKFIGTVESIYKYGPNPTGRQPYRLQWYAVIKIDELMFGIYENERIKLNLGDTNSTSLKEGHTFKFEAIQGRHGYHLSTYEEIKK